MKLKLNRAYSNRLNSNQILWSETKFRNTNWKTNNNDQRINYEKNIYNDSLDGLLKSFVITMLFSFCKVLDDSIYNHIIIIYRPSSAGLVSALSKYFNKHG